MAVPKYAHLISSLPTRYKKALTAAIDKRSIYQPNTKLEVSIMCKLTEIDQLMHEAGFTDSYYLTIGFVPIADHLVVMVNNDHYNKHVHKPIQISFDLPYAPGTVVHSTEEETKDAD